MTRLLAIVLGLASISSAQAQGLPTVGCATYATMADNQAGLVREAAREAEAVARGGLKVLEPDVQAAFDRLRKAAEAAAPAIADLATAWEDVQIETSRCRVLENRAKP